MQKRYSLQRGSLIRPSVVGVQTFPSNKYQEPPDNVFYSPTNTVPTTAPTDGTDTHVLLNGDRYDWDGTQWLKQPANDDRVLYTGNTTVPTAMPPKGVDTAVLSNGDRYDWNGTAWVQVPNETITNFGTPVVTYPTANTINIALPYNQEGGTVQNVNIPITLPTPVSVVNSIDFKPTANANEFTVEITYTNDLGVQNTITDTTPVVFPRGAWDNPDGTPATQASGSINYMAGNVGIGTTTPAALLHTVKAGGNVARIESDGLYSGLVSYLPTSHFFSGVQDVDGVSRYNVVNNITATEALSVNAVTSNTGLKLPQAFNTLHVGAAFVPNTGGVRLPITSTSAAQTGQPIGVDANGDIVRLTATSFDATVSFSTATPTAGGVVFTPNTPASTTVLYVSAVDGSQWTYNGTTYVTQPASADWKTAGNAGSVQATSFVGTTDNVGLSFRTNNVIRQTITNTGNIGLGTTTPQTALTLGANSTGISFLGVGSSFNGGRLGGIKAFQLGDSNGGLTFETFSGGSGGSEKMRITNIGNVGINTTTPLSLLSLRQTNPELGFYSTTSTFNSGKTSIIKSLTLGDGNGHLSFETYAGGSGGGDRMRITNIGNVGIGTTAPTEKLEVAGAIKLASGQPTDKIYTNNTNGLVLESQGNLYGTVKMTLQNVTGSNGALFETVGASNPQLLDFGFKTTVAQRNIRFETRGGFLGASPEFQFGSAGNPNFVMSDNVANFRTGNVGIGTDAPTQKLHVIGNIVASGTITPSDKRLKSNIKDVTYGVKDLLKLKPVSYTKKFSLDKAEKGEVNEFGFIAQDLQKGMPELVTENGADKLLAVNYTSLIPVLVKAIQEQQKEIETLKLKIK